MAQLLIAANCRWRIGRNSYARPVFPRQSRIMPATYLCNATLYLSHHIAQRQRLRTKSAFIHVPLDTSQVAKGRDEIAALPAAMTASALQLIVEDLIKRERAVARVLA